MAKFIIGEKVSMEVSVGPEPAQVVDTRVDKVSDRQYEIKDMVDSLKQEMAIVEEKVDNNYDSIMDTVSMVNNALMKDPEPCKCRCVKTPPSVTETKEVVIHHNHTKDIEDLYGYISEQKDQLKKQLKLEIKKEKEYNNKLKKMVILMSVLSVTSLMLHMF